MKKVLLGVILLVVILTFTGCMCKHETTELINSLEATCQQEGYSGDTYCTECNEKISVGDVILAKGHIQGDAVGVIPPTCANYGYSGDIYCKECSELLVEGYSIDKLEHQPGEMKNVIIATCYYYGYTGDVFCEECGELLQEGEVVDPIPHTPGELENAQDPTCTTSGYTGDIRCTVCDFSIEYGETISALPHELVLQNDGYEATCEQSGYGGTSICSVCTTAVPGEVLPMVDHNYVNNLCTWCGWWNPGLYIDDELVLTWEELKESGYVVVDEKGQLISVEGNFAGGKLVVGEDVVYLDGNNYYTEPGIRYATASEIWLPRSITELGSFILNKNEYVTNVVMYCNVTRIPGNCFEGARALKNIVLPDNVTTIDGAAFEDCFSLKELDLPQSLTSLGVEVFSGCGITELELPDNLQSIGLRAFAYSNLKNITIPASVTFIDAEAFAYNKSLESVDMSAAQITELDYGLFTNCMNLREVRLPDCLQTFSSGLFGSSYSDDNIALTELVLPDGFRDFGRERFEKAPLTKIVWPASLIDGSNLENCPLQEIYYRGTEAQWKMVTGREYFPDATVVFNYGGY